MAVAEKTDAELVALARSADKDAFGQLIERYQPMAKRIALAGLKRKSRNNKGIIQAWQIVHIKT